MWRALWLILASFLFLRAGDDPRVLEPKKFEEQCQGENVQILDVRTPGEYAAGHLNDAVNIDFFAEGFEERIKELPKDKTYMVYCKSGGRSGKTAAMMTKAGYDVYDMAGGFTRWHAEGLPVAQPEHQGHDHQ